MDSIEIEKAEDEIKVLDTHINAFDYLDNDETVLERQPMERLAEEGQLMSYLYKGFWQCMDTQREKDILEKLLGTGKAPWVKWEM